MKVIIFGNNLQNTLGLVRSVGMKGYEVMSDIANILAKYTI